MGVLVLLGFLALAPAAAPEPPAFAALDGLWLSDGYGDLAEIRRGTLKLFEITPYSCIESRTLTERAAPADPRGRRFVGADAESDLFLTPGPSDDAEWFGDPEAASKILFRRTDARPAPCARPAVNDPPTNFEVFAWTFGAHHGFLAHRGVDWPAVVAAHRPKVTASTKPADLFDVLRDMIEPLHDAHTFIDALDIKRTYQGKRPGTRERSPAQTKRTEETVETRYLAGRPRSWCRGHLRYGRLKGGPGYLRVDSFYGYAKRGGFDPSARALEDALDEVVRDAHGLPGLVIDVRINRGGDDPLGVLIAGRLTDAPYVAYVKRARNDPNDPTKWTEPQTVTVRPSDRARFTGPVVELIGPDTVSAGETFTMALMGRSPRITRVGEDTQGVYSDVLGRSLPNGWKFGMPNEVFLTEKGEHFEARGVPPDVRIAVFPQSDLDAGRDPALERAIAILTAAR